MTDTSQLHFESCNGVGSPTRAFSVNKTSLSWVQNGEAAQIPLRDITELRHLTYRSAQGYQAMQCKLFASRGRNVLIRSLHFAGVGQFDDRLETYRPFMRALITRTAEAAPNARFLKGSTGLMIAWGITAFLVLVVLGLVGFIMLDGAGQPDARMLGIISVLVAAGLFSLTQLMRGGTKKFDPGKLDEIGL